MVLVYALYLHVYMHICMAISLLMLVGGLRISEKNIDIIYLIHGVLKNEIFGLWKIYIFPWYLLLQFENLFVLTL